MMVNDANIRRFVTNMFAFPEGYFEQHTPEELHVTEEERQELIRLHAKRHDDETSEDRRAKRLDEYERELFG